MAAPLREIDRYQVALDYHHALIGHGGSLLGCKQLSIVRQVVIGLAKWHFPFWKYIQIPKGFLYRRYRIKGYQHKRYRFKRYQSDSDAMAAAVSEVKRY